MIGKRLSHFRILEKIGEGGMGVVYKAVDEKLGRNVALKVLQPDAVGDESRRMRFMREARAAAAVITPARRLWPPMTVTSSPAAAARADDPSDVVDEIGLALCAQRAVVHQ